MHAHDLKRWHWVLIGLVLGLVVSYVWTLIEPIERYTTNPPRFAEALLRPPHEGHPFATDVTVYPPITDHAGHTVYPVTLSLLLPTDEGPSVWAYRPTSMRAEVPFTADRFGRSPEEAGSGDDAGETILSWLERAAGEHEHVRYRYAWERERWATYAMWTGGSVLLIGGIWPTVLRMLVGDQSPPPEPAYDLDRFGQGESASSTDRAAAREMSADDAVRLQAVQQSLEAGLNGFGAGSGLGGAGGAAAPAATRPLDGGPLESSTTPDELQEQKDYEGEFYPVARSHKKHGDAPPDCGARRDDT